MGTIKPRQYTAKVYDIAVIHRTQSVAKHWKRYQAARARLPLPGGLWGRPLSVARRVGAAAAVGCALYGSSVSPLASDAVRVLSVSRCSVELASCSTSPLSPNPRERKLRPPLPHS